jgi:PAS domain S-box-containing protein
VTATPRPHSEHNGPDDTPSHDAELRAALEAAQRLSAIVASSDDAIVSKDLNGTVTSWNAAAERIFGYTAAEMIGQPILKIIPPELHPDEARILATIASGRRIDHFETVRMNKNGERLDISLTVSPVKDREGRIIGAAKIARDVTRSKKAERALRTAERLASVGRLAATVAHEINNPLEALTNLIYLAKHAAQNDVVRDYLERADEELRRVSMISKQTLGFYREVKDTSTTRLGEMALGILPIFSSRSRNRGIEIVPQIKGDPAVMAVPGEIRQLIANLVGNSLDAVERGGQILIRVSDACSRRHGMAIPGVRLSVADDGCGITPEIRAQLFEPFFTTKRDVGTGLGLWVCKSIVEKHHGSIRLKSRTTPGKSGTVFSVFLPARTQAAQDEHILRHAV